MIERRLGWPAGSPEPVRPHRRDWARAPTDAGATTMMMPPRHAQTRPPEYRTSPFATGAPNGMECAVENRYYPNLLLACGWWAPDALRRYRILHRFAESTLRGDIGQVDLGSQSGRI